MWRNLCTAAVSEVKAHSSCWATVLDAPLYMTGPETASPWSGGTRSTTCSTRASTCITNICANTESKTLASPSGACSTRSRLSATPVAATSCTSTSTNPRRRRAQPHLTPTPRAHAPHQIRHPGPERQRLLGRITTACREMTQLADHLGAFAALFVPDVDNARRLDAWIAEVRHCDLPHLRSFVRGLQQNIEAIVAALTFPCSNGPTESVNTKTKLTARQMHGRAGFNLLRHRILLGWHHPALPPHVRQGRRSYRPRPQECRLGEWSKS